MAGALIGALRVTLGLDSAAFEKGADDARKRLKGFQREFASTGQSMVQAGAVLSAGITAPFAALVASAIPAATESRQALAQVNAALESMGPVAGRTSAELVKMAGDLQNISNFDDDDILKSVTANMLTFGNVSGEAFDRAQLAAVNLSARLGQDLQSSAIQVGKALNDPIKGVTALQRVGVSFTEAQKAQITAMVEGGNAAGAQALILGELEKQFGGAAAAQRAATPTAETQQAWRTFQETVGELALKLLPPLTTLLTQVLNGFNALSPGMQTVIVAGAALAAALGPVLIGIGSLISLTGTLLPVLAPIGAGITGIATAITAAAAPALVAMAAAIVPLLPVLAALAGAAALVYATWKNWDQITAIAQNLYIGVKTWVMDKLGGVFTWLQDKLIATGKWFFDLYDKVVGNSYIPDMVDAIGQHIGRLDGLMVQPVGDATTAAGDAFADLQTRLDGFANDNAETQKRSTGEIVESYANMAQGVLGSISGLAGAIKGGGFLDILDGVLGVITQIAGVFGGAGGLFKGSTPKGADGVSGLNLGGLLPKRERGGPVRAGSAYLVGERGAEILQMGAQSGNIIPNNKIGGGGQMVRVLVQANDYFDAKVVDTSGRVVLARAPAIAAAGADGAAAQQARQQSRRLA